MRIGDLLVAANLVKPDEIDAAVKRQVAEGGRLGESLVELGFIKTEVLEAFLNQVPHVPMSVAETGNHNLHRRAEIGLAMVSGDTGHLSDVLDRCERLVAGRPEVELLSVRRRLHSDED